MKKIVILSIMVFVVLSLFAHSDLMVFKPRVKLDKTKVILPSNNRDLQLPDPPEYEFFRTPVDLGGTIYDYMPGSYCSLPIRVQPEVTNTGLTANGIYIAFHSRVSSSSNRRVNYAYIDPNGNVTASGPIGSQDMWEGYPGVDIDPLTADPFVAFHVDVDGNGVLDNNFSYDQYNMAGMPGLWLNPPFTVINNTILQQQGIIQNGDEFIWPYVYIGPSPVEGKRRVYVTTNNATSSPATGDPSENVLLAYADFNEDDIMASDPSSWNWQYRTIQQFDDWHNGNPQWARAQKTMIVKDNFVIYVGTVLFEDYSSRMFALVNDNYGEGDFTYYEFDYETAWDNIDDFLLPNGNWFFGQESQAQDLKWSAWPGWNSHFNAIVRDDNTVVFPGVLLPEFYSQEQEGYVYYPGYEMMYPKLFKFNLDTHEFGIEDVYPADGTEDNMPIVPWDLNEDGQVDQYDDDGYPEYVHSFPSFHTNTDNAFHYGGIRITENKEKGWETIVWNDAWEAYYQSIGVDGYDDWVDTPKIMISVRNNNLNSWSTPIKIVAKPGNDYYNEVIDGMIPCYVYPGDKIEAVNDTLGTLHIFFLNDDSYGSSIQNEGSNPNPDNCRLEYAALNVEFTYPTLSTENAQISSVNLLNAKNYPNPFNPTTTIKYNVVANGNVKVEIYNLTGQKVTTLVNSDQKVGEHSVVWNGTDNTGKTVASGIYLYKIKNGKYTSTKKMILMK